MTLFGPTGDAPFKALRNAGCVTRVVQACLRYTHWLDGTPITDVLAMAGVPDRYRRFVVAETLLCLARPHEVLERPGIRDKIDGLGQGASLVRSPGRTGSSYSGCSRPDTRHRCTDTA